MRVATKRSRIGLFALGLLLFLLATFGDDIGLGAQPGWVQRAPAPEARSEVAGAFAGGEIAIVGGFLADGGSSSRVDLYSPKTNSWRRLPDLPVAVNHSMAASDGRRLFVAGGYTVGGTLLRDAFVFERGAWRRLPQMPEARAAAGAAFVGGRFYVVGGLDDARLARTMLVLDVRTRRWSRLPGPTPREHLGVVAARGAVYAVGGRTAGLDTNLATFEVYEAARKRWRALSPVPERRGGTDAAALGGRIVSVGGEATTGTIASVYAYEIANRRWRRLPDLPTPRHGLAVVSSGNSIYAIAGGDVPGLTVTTANEALELG